MENEELKSKFWSELEKLVNAGVHIAATALRAVRPDISMIGNETNPSIDKKLIIAPFENDQIYNCLYIKPEVEIEPRLYAMTSYVIPSLIKVSLTDGSIYDILLKVPSSNKEIRKLLKERGIDFYVQDIEKLFPTKFFKEGNWSRTCIWSGNTIAGAIPVPNK